MSPITTSKMSNFRGVNLCAALHGNHCQLHGPSGPVINMERLHCSRFSLDR